MQSPEMSSPDDSPVTEPAEEGGSSQPPAADEGAGDSGTETLEDDL